MKTYFQTASSRISKALYKEYDEYCAAKGKTIHMDLKEFIEQSLEKKNDVGKLGKDGDSIQKIPAPAPKTEWFW